MNILIVNKFAHRLKNGKVLYSATVEHMASNSGDHLKIKDDWKVRSPKEMELTGAEADTIRNELSRYAEIFPTEDYRLPANEGVDGVALANATAQGME